MSSVIEGPMVFVDTETTGMDYRRGKIIEIAAVRVERGKEVSRFSTLLNPGMAISPFITNITGITAEKLEAAPSFESIAPKLLELLEDAVLVAHNVRFDYAFLKHEFARLSIAFQPRMACTVKLSRALYPTLRSHSLDNLIKHHGLFMKHRHRALDDTLAIFNFYTIALKTHGSDVVEAALRKQIKRPSLPSALSDVKINALPESTGVYVFEDENKKPLYIGKSINLRKRVLSHFSQDHSSTRELKIAQQIRNVSIYPTHGELSALLLESQMIKDLQPLYNRKLRRSQRLILIKKEADSRGYFRIVSDDTDIIEPSELTDLLAVFATKGQAKQAIEGYRKLFDLCPQTLGLEKGKGSCFMYQINKCRGACIGAEPVELHNFRLQCAFESSRIRNWPYKGPVVIEEVSETGSSGLVVDQWCILARLNSEQYNDPVVTPFKKKFELDTYKILRSFVLNKKIQLSIKPVPLAMLSNLLQGNTLA